MVANHFILLRCPKCGRKMHTPRDDSDPPGSAVMIVQCPKCNGGDFDAPIYLDGKGSEIPYAESTQRTNSE